jgi:hypothetical protein
MYVLPKFSRVTGWNDNLGRMDGCCDGPKSMVEWIPKNVLLKLRNWMIRIYLVKQLSGWKLLFKFNFLAPRLRSLQSNCPILNLIIQWFRLVQVVVQFYVY